MTVELAAIMVIALLVVLILAEVPIAFSLMISGVVGLLLLDRGASAFSALSALPYTATAKYDMLVIPMFVLLGTFIGNAGIATKIFMAANRLVGWVPGGLAVATVFACTIFGGISGSSAADTATIGRISVTEMRRHGYSLKFSAGLVAAAGTVAILIPPSIPLVVYGILTGVSISQLLLAGLVPGLVSGLVFALYAMAWAVWQKYSGRRQVADATWTKPEHSVANASRKRGGLLGLGYAAVLFFIIIGGLYTGLFTTTEAAAVGAFAALLISVISVKANGESVASLLKVSMGETAQFTSMIFALLIGTAIFTYFLAVTRIPISLTAWITELQVSPKIVVLVFLALLIPLGMILDGLSIMLLTVPIAYPAMVALGVDGVWLGILVITMIELSLITPPVGINVFVIAGLVDDLSLEEAFAGVTPFIVIQLFLTGLLFIFPDIALFLPRMAAP